MRKDQWNTTLSVDGKNLGTFDVKTGGETDTDELTYKPGGMAPQVSLGGMVTVAAVVLNRLYRLDRDQGFAHWLLGRVGKGKAVVHQQPLDPDGNAYGKGFTINGTLKRVNLPEVDSNATDPALLEIEITPYGTVA